MQCGGVSIWHDPSRVLRHTLYAYHELQPPIQSETLGMRATSLALAPVIGAPPAATAPRRRATGEHGSVHGDTDKAQGGEGCDRVDLVAVMSHGQLWKWRVPLPAAPPAAEADDNAPSRDMTSSSLTRGATARSSLFCLSCPCTAPK